MTATLPPPDEEKQARALHEAAVWYARLTCENTTSQDRQAWQAWHAADPSHQQAWNKVETVRRQFGQLPGALTLSTLQRSARQRRAVLGGLIFTACAAPTLLWMLRDTPWRRWGAGYQTAVGERRNLDLPDGSTLVLDTDTAADIDYSPTHRRVRLHAGTLLANVRPETSGSPRPFEILTFHGSTQALGTRFTVTTDREASCVEVIEHAVRTRIAHADQSTILHAGQRQRFTRDQADAPQTANPFADSWAQGSLVAVDMPLSTWVKEISRYRRGLITYDPALAKLRISGAFSLDDTDIALAALASGFPVAVHSRTRYWISLLPR